MSLTRDLARLDIDSDGDINSIGHSTNLLSNGDFTTNTTGWAATGSTLAIVSNELQLTPGAGVNGFANQQVDNLVVGRSYVASVTVTVDAASYSRLYIGTSANGNQTVDSINLGTGTHSFIFTATATTHHFALVVGGGTQQVTRFDNAKLIEANNITFSAKYGKINGILAVDRESSTGTTIDVQKDGTSLASIGSSGSAGFIVLNKSTSSGVGLFGSTNNGGCLLPTDGAVNTPDNAKDLGRADVRWRNIYLSGGAYIGGTAGANHLDDYETGSFQMTMTGESSGAALGYGVYVKVGNICHFNWYSGTRTINSTVNGVLGGLPFTHTSPYTGSAYASVVFAHNTWVNDAAAGYINVGTTSIYPTRNNGSGANQTSQGSKYVMCSGSYYCD